MESVKYNLGNFKEELYCSKPLFFSKFVEEKLSDYIGNIKGSKIKQANPPRGLKTFWGKEGPTSCKLRLSFMFRFKNNYQVPSSNEIYKKTIILVTEGKVKMGLRDFARALNYDFTSSFRDILRKFPNYHEMVKLLRSMIANLFPLTLTYDYFVVINLWLGKNEEIKDVGVGISLVSLNFEGKFGRARYGDFVGSLNERFTILENELKKKLGENSEDIKQFMEIWRPALLKLFDILRKDGWEIVKGWLNEIFENVDYGKVKIAMQYLNSQNKI